MTTCCSATRSAPVRHGTALQPFDHPCGPTPQPFRVDRCLYLHMATLNTRLAHDVNRAFPEFVATHQNAVFSMARGLARNHHDAEDIAQEAFVRAYRSLQKWDADRIKELHAKAWMAQIVLNLVRNAARSKSRRPATSVLDLAPPTPSDAPGPDEETVSEAELIEWRARLADLPSPEATAVVLRHVYGLSYREIAEVSNSPEGTAKARVHRGVDKLRTIMEAANV